MKFIVVALMLLRAEYVIDTPTRKVLHDLESVFDLCAEPARFSDKICSPLEAPTLEVSSPSAKGATVQGLPDGRSTQSSIAG